MAVQPSNCTSSKREMLMSVMKNCDVDELINITKSVAGSELSDALAEFSKTHLQGFWESVYGMCTSTLMSDNEMEDVEFAATMHQVLKVTTDLAHATITALLAQKCDNGDKNATKVPQSLQETVILLHSMLPNLDEKQVVLKNQLSRLCEDWWYHKLDGWQELASNTFFFLMTRSTQAKASQSDVSRVWAMRGMLKSAMTNSRDQHCTALISLLKQCTHHPQYLTSKHGIMFLSFLIALTPELTDNLHQCIKTVVFTTPKSWHTKYGEVYFRSWQGANDEMRQKIEESCIQDLMFRAVHACRQGPHCASAAFFRLLSHFHKQKTQRGVEAMLARLYGPILWRSLKVTNSDVRLNAAALMFNVFPLQDPTLLREEADAALQRQFDLMNSLLSDPVVEIRVTTVLGIGRVLNMYWELIPVQVIQSLVASLVQDMMYDSASPAVREAVLKVMYQLCDNHLCIPMLKKVLPELGNFIHDNSEKVRVAMMDLLLKVKGLRAIKYWNIVPIEHILSRLETDSHFVSRRIMSLISASFVPLNQPPSQQVERCLALISGNRGAARQFFLNLSKSLGVVDTTKYIIVLCRYALESSRLWTKNVSGHLQSEDTNEDYTGSTRSVSKKTPKSKTKKRRSRSSSRVSGEIEEDEDNSSVERNSGPETSQTDGEGEISFNLELLSGLMEGVYLMFSSIVSELSSLEHVALKEGLMKKLSVTVRELIRISDDPLLEQALIGLAGHLPSRAMPLVSQNLFNKLKQNCSSQNILDSHSKSEELINIVKALVQWGRTEEMLELVQESVSEFLKKKASDTPSKSKGAKLSPKGKKTVAFSTGEASIDVGRSLEILDVMMSHAECRPILIYKHREAIGSLITHLEKKIQSKLQQDLKFLSDSDTGPGNGKEKKKHVASETEIQLSISVSIFTYYMRLVVFLSLKPDNGIDEKEKPSVSRRVDVDNAIANTGRSCMRNCMTWVCQDLLPQLQSQSDVKHWAWLNVMSQLVGTMLKACSGLVITGFYDAMIFDQIGEVCTAVLKLPPNSLTNFLLEKMLVFTYQITQIRREEEEGVDVEAEEDDAESMDVEREEEGRPKKSQDGSSSSPLKSPLKFALSVFETAYKIIVLKTGESDVSKAANGNKESVSMSTVHSSMGEIVLALVMPGVGSELFDKTMRLVSDLVIHEVERMSRLELIAAENGKSPDLNHKLLMCLKKSSKALRSFVEFCVDHLGSDQVNVHSLHGIVSIAGVVKTSPSAAVDSDLKDAVTRCLDKISPNGMDEDLFSDVKSQIEQKTRVWSESA